MRKSFQLLISIFILLILLVPNTVLGNEQTEPLEFDRASVHDPSIIKEEGEDVYYVFGSHIAAAKSDDLINWTSIVDREYETPENNPIYGDLSNNLAESFEWAGEDDADSSGGFAVWAPDIFYNKDYLHEDGSTGAYMMYYSVSSTYIRSAIGIAVSENIEGPYQYVDTIMYSGFTNYETYDNSSDVNKHYENTNIPDLIEKGDIDEVNPDWFTEDGDFNNALYTNAIDANILYDENGTLWMTYGSWSGGTFILELDKQTGLPKYPGKDGQTEDGRMIDRYYGTKIAGGYGRSGEATYAVYDEESEYYYLYITYGGLASDGGYQMRQFRSENIKGPYTDASGNKAVFPDSFDMGVGNFPGNDDHKDIGNKMMGNFLFKRDLGEDGSGIGTGYAAPGHNSYYSDSETGKEFIVTHTRFPEQGEMHEVRVHQTFKNSDKWPVPTPYHYAGETIETVSSGDVTGDYKFINHGEEITGEVTESTWVKLNEDNTISGSVEGTWELYDNYRAKLTINGDNTYDGVFIKQYDPTSESWVMTFSAMSDDGVVIWGSHVEESSDEELVAAIKEELRNTISETVTNDLSLQTVATRGTEISWESSNTEVISNEGEVVRPRLGSDDVSVTLTANISLGDVTETLTVETTVLAESEGGLAAYYNFNDSFEDTTGSKDDATVTGNRIDNEGGNITFADGVVGQAAKFDGESGLRLADGLIASDTYTVSLWVKPEEITEFTTTFFGARTENNWISVTPNAGGVTKAWVHNGSDWYDLTSDSIIPVDEWTHFTLTVNGGESKVYINGEEKYSGQDFPNIFTSVDASFGLGVNYWDTPFKGLMDEVRVYDGMALPEQEVQQLYQNPEGLTANYNFEDSLNEETGNFDAGSITGDLIDNTGGSISYTEGISGQAAVFNGESGVRLPDGLLSGNEYSVSLWLNPSELNDYTTAFFGTRTNSNWVSLVPAGPVGGETHTDVMVDSDGNDRYHATIGDTIPTNAWTHVAFTVDNGDAVVYINGEEAFAGQDFPNVFTTEEALFGLGVNYWDTPYKGLMDDLRIYGETALSAQDIKAYYDSVVEDPSEPEIDVTDLEQLIETAKEFSSDRYTESSYAALQAAITDAQAALNVVNSQEAVTAAITALQAAIDGLVEQDSDPNPDPQPEPEETIISDTKDLELDDNVYKTNKVTKTTEFKKEVINQLNDDASVEMTYKEVKATVPVSVLKINADVTFNFDDVSDKVKSNNADSLSELYDFTLTSNGENVSFDTPITLTFTIDPKKVTNWEDIKVVYIDENGIKQEMITPISYNKETGEVVAEVTHFSVYGVFEIAEADPDVTDLEKLIEKAEELSGDGYTESSYAALQAAITDAQAALNAVNSEEEVTEAIIALQAAIDGLEETETNTEEPVDEEETTEDSNEETKEADADESSGEELPETATNQYNWLVLGALLLVIGFSTIIVIRKNKNQES
ncbi:LamG-like jellyroll fold domain-containing protein [Aquibacillus rhizosphaerae]|uniref:Glycoside hydrolase family 43 C-terminal domain-containing protein n=1 Tax=Aquibacillus rhizosphaerae TaxID=3051431 RepID=A0ABT7LBE6_9BACI|nr:LamG-like jellyroll fold domain-containing protein [Aquibacillus sp. LR5S19]MDL4843194.1 glycoside hydrolase family 43 C-terminal domain-containing protein [Aquibacillus sp. LR5S19]